MTAHARFLASPRGRRRPAGACSLLVLASVAWFTASCPLLAQPAAAAAPARQEVEADAAPASLVSYGASATYASAFVWRGFVIGSDPAFQPSAWVGIGPVTITSWSNSEVPSLRGAVFSEHDLTVDVSHEVGGVTLSAGWTNYAFVTADTGRYSNEFYVGIAGGGYLNPSLRIYEDVHEGKGTYAAVCVGHDYELPAAGITLMPSLSLGYNRHQWTDRTGFSDLTATLAIGLPTPSSRLSLEPFLAYSHGFDTAVFPRRFFAGVTLAVE